MIIFSLVIFVRVSLFRLFFLILFLFFSSVVRGTRSRRERSDFFSIRNDSISFANGHSTCVKRHTVVRNFGTRHDRGVASKSHNYYYRFVERLLTDDAVRAQDAQ